MKCSCGSKSGFYWTGKERNEVRCDKCGKVGSMEEFGCVVHCNDKPSAAEPILTRVEHGLGGVDEAQAVREQIASLNDQLRQALKTDLDHRFEACNIMADAQRKINKLQELLTWERACQRQAVEEIAEARYWARKLYQDTATVFMTVDTKFEIPEWVTWVDGSPT